MGGRRRRQQVPQGLFEAEVDAMTHDGRGIARVDGKATFLYGALTGELVRFRYTDCRRHHDAGITTEVLRPSLQRVEPRCAHHGICGGCSLQHLEPAMQVEMKQNLMLDNLRQIGGVGPAQLLPPLLNEAPWGYRRKARLGVKFVTAKQRLLVGFRERGSSLVADLQQCHVLHPRVGNLLSDLRELIGALDIARRLPQVEMAMDDEQCVLVLRILEPLSDADRSRLEAFQRLHPVVFYVQPGGPGTIAPLNVEVDLHYRLPADDLTLGFQPGDFTQVNTEINRKMVASAVALLEPGPQDRVLDLFCGIGNFTLPLARHAGAVVGIEGDPGLVARARENARRNALHNVEFHAADLYAEIGTAQWASGNFDLVLLDPPRSGAWEVLPTIAGCAARRILYVSCYPGTLARDAGELVKRYGYQLQSAGVMDMFPHTAHVESIALFVKRH